MALEVRRRLFKILMRFGAIILTRFPFWNCFSMLMLFAERADQRRKPDIPVPYLYFDMGAAVICASFMSFGVKRRWFALGAALQLAVSTYASYIGEQVHYGDWLKVRMYSRTIAVIGGFLILASGAGEVYRQKPRTRSLQSTGQVFLGINLICVAYSLQHSKEDRLAYLNHIIGVIHAGKLHWKCATEVPDDLAGNFKRLLLCKVSGFPTEPAGHFEIIVLLYDKFYFPPQGHWYPQLHSLTRHPSGSSDLK
ncbi:transmembrane protein 101 isoform X2 [Chiloscyllium plagiosum]|uniref:transmembrane protein 101 isoform X2 n=1 Tax=Chiloscyllium plagiosum TaxID=36176 RepID=UPI001CB88902|nr:transmembrane protein 101 isoform X2 [Chiloscyllium plagiosum]